MKKKGRLLKLFTTSLYISAFTFGGGFVIIPLMRKKFVEDLHWLEEQEMLDLAAIAQSAPRRYCRQFGNIARLQDNGNIGCVSRHSRHDNSAHGHNFRNILFLQRISHKRGCKRSSFGNAGGSCGGYMRCSHHNGYDQRKTKQVVVGSGDACCVCSDLFLRCQRGVHHFRMYRNRHCLVCSTARTQKAT